MACLKPHIWQLTQSGFEPTQAGSRIHVLKHRGDTRALAPTGIHTYSHWSMFVLLVGWTHTHTQCNHMCENKREKDPSVCGPQGLCTAFTHLGIWERKEIWGWGQMALEAGLGSIQPPGWWSSRVSGKNPQVCPGIFAMQSASWVLWRSVVLVVVWVLNQRFGFKSLPALRTG